jgi:2-polyprenyl-3-methyl-5-hydroxy-6-metoxy-1,4-benzoquinol methylase
MSFEVDDTEERACPLCSGNNARFESEEGIFRLWRCNSCGMLYTRNPLSFERKLTYFEKGTKLCQDTRNNLGIAHYTLANQIKSVPLYSTALREICKHFPIGLVNIVDVGCAGGLFLLGAQVVEDGFNIDKPPRFKVRGVAFDPREKTDTERFTGCVTFMIDEAAEKLNNWANVVTLFNVLEHVNDLKECLNAMHLVLKDGGILLVDVPNHLVMDWKSKMLRRWPRLDLSEHINYFVPKTLNRLMKQAGFKFVKHLQGSIQGPAGFGSRATWRQRLRWVFAIILFQATFHKLQTFSHMTVIYRKIRVKGDEKCI